MSIGWAVLLKHWIGGRVAVSLLVLVFFSICIDKTRLNVLKDVFVRVKSVRIHACHVGDSVIIIVFCVDQRSPII